MEDEATRHLERHADPVYPAIARAAHIQGTVLLHVTVDAAGTPVNLEVVSGPPILRGAAVEAVRGWRYAPFEQGGKPAGARLVVSVPFSLGIPAATETSDEAVGQAFFPKSDACRADNTAGHWTEAVKTCGDAMAIAQRFPAPEQRTNEIRSAHEEYGEALAFSGNLPEALTQFQAAVANASKSLTARDAEYGTAYYWQAFAEHASHMPRRLSATTLRRRPATDWLSSIFLR